MDHIVYFLAVYALSALGMHLVSKHTLASWGRAYREGTPVSLLAPWHPTFDRNLFGGRRPHRKPTNADVLSCCWMTYSPVLNTLMLAVILVCSSVEALYVGMRACRQIRLRQRGLLPAVERQEPLSQNAVFLPSSSATFTGGAFSFVL